MFDNIEYTEDIEVMKKWIPLMMKGREDNPGIMAASKIDDGTDVNFGNLTRSLLSNLKDEGVELYYNHSVQNIRRNQDNTWQLKIYNS
ncbi:malate:quinone oxidoreductase, partial [Bacteroides acidifaciens]|uniref:malate:quinone oxidoreductase n=1 Tax=Bacteroides acidifaciens TaxID=85831 RepID=UPI001D16120B